MTMQNVNDDILRVAARSLGGRAERFSLTSRWTLYSFGNLSFASHGMRMPFDEPTAIESANNKLLSRSILEGKVPIIPWQLIDTSSPPIVSGEHEWVLKPVAGMKGAGVIPRLKAEDLPYYCEALGRQNRFLFIEPYVEGTKLRVLVLNGKVIGVSAASPTILTGDGTHTVLELIESIPERSPLTYGSRLIYDIEVENALRHQRLCATDIPASGVQFYPTFVVNISRGAHWRRIDEAQKDMQHVISISKSAANAVGLCLAGVDIVVPDQGDPVILEVNPSPGIVGHTWDPDKKMVDMKPAQEILNAAIDFFREGASGKVVFTSMSQDDYLLALKNL